MKQKTFIFFAFLVSFLSVNCVHAQSLVQDASAPMQQGLGENVFPETIKIISESKKVFILSNNNQQLGPGDFISLALDDKLAARAVVAKVHQGQVGIKILKIYSISQWSRLRRNLDVLIVKGDDSLFGKQPEEKVAEKGKIRNEEDLYSEDIVADEELGLIDENSKRHIKPDNVISVSAAYFSADDIDGGTARTNEFGGSWSYQEGYYGIARLKNYPGDGISTATSHMIGRIKYNFKAPLYSYIMPYVGFQYYNISSPDAGKGNDTQVTPAQKEAELKAIDDLKKSGPVVGVTILRRLVPGWFFKADIGTDVMNLGFAIEF
jgi:hypothetical protein